MAYWEERQTALYRAEEMRVNEYFKHLEKAFNQARRELQKVVESFYWRYAEENALTYAEAQKRLNKAEIGELQDYVDLVMKNIGKYNQKVNNMSIKARMTRYQALEAQVDAILRQLYAVDYQSEAEDTLREVYEDSYYHTWYNIDQYHGFHAEFAQIDPRSVDTLLKYPFNGANFSDRLWKQKDHLQSQLMESLTTIMIQGVPPQNLVNDFAKKMQSKKFDAYRLLHTESSYLISEATHAGYKEDGVEQYRILATLDSKTCGICGKLDNQIFQVDEAVVGKNMPPFHCFCRCTDVAYYPDTPTEGMTRVARDPETGKTYEVPADMSYEEWKKKYLDGKAEQQEGNSDSKQEKYSLDKENQEKYQGIARLWNAQAYKPVSRGESSSMEIKPNQQVKVKKVDSYSDEVYISDKANIKPRALHLINRNTEKALEKWGILLKRKPKIVIVSPNEMPTAYGKYDAINNIVYYIPEIANEKIIANVGDIEYHELWHMKQAENFREKYGDITQENYGKYIEYSCMRAKKVIDEAGIDKYNVSDISDYAMKMYQMGRYDEVEAEYMVNGFRRK